ncbi:MAG: hypothetical protein HY720_23880 [Planctomycetes bacterium]|nr:hypothetical protein [Planctomycetota bacterium]
MELPIKRTAVQIEFGETDEGREAARSFVERYQRSGQPGKALLSGTNRNKVKLYRPGRFDLQSLEILAHQARLEDLVALARQIRFQFRIEPRKKDSVDP